VNLGSSSVRGMIRSNEHRALLTTYYGLLLDWTELILYHTTLKI
jgi:hypothetical protein